MRRNFLVSRGNLEDMVARQQLRILVSAVSFILRRRLAGFGCRAEGPARDATLEATITIDASKPASYEIPRTIFGTFLEPIGNSIYGGLWAELLQNPSFKDNLWNAGTIQKMLSDEPQLARASQLGLPLPWEPLDAMQGNRYEPRWKDAANSYRSLFPDWLAGQAGGSAAKNLSSGSSNAEMCRELVREIRSGPPGNRRFLAEARSSGRGVCS